MRSVATARTATPKIGRARAHGTAEFAHGTQKSLRGGRPSELFAKSPCVLIQSGGIWFWEGKRANMHRRRCILDRPLPALKENGECVVFDRPEMFAYPPSTDGWTVIEWDGRFRYRVRTETLERDTHLCS